MTPLKSHRHANQQISEDTRTSSNKFGPRGFQPTVGASQLCEVFSKRASELFWPAYVLTGSLETSESCFVRAIDAALTQLPSDEAYIYPVARRCVIKAAIATMEEEIKKCAEREVNQDWNDSRWRECRLRGRFSIFNSSIAANTLPSLWALNMLRRSALVLRFFERWHRKDAALTLGVSLASLELAGQHGLSEFLEHLANTNSDGFSEFAVVPALERSR